MRNVTVTVLVFLSFLTNLNAKDHGENSRGSSSTKSDSKEAPPFPKNFDALLATLEESKPMTSEAADKKKNNEDFLIGGKDSVFSSLISSLKDYRQKLQACTGDESAGRLATLIDDYVNSIHGSLSQEATAKGSGFENEFPGFVSDILNPRKKKTHPISEKLVNTYTLQIRKILEKKQSAFSSQKENFAAEDEAITKTLNSMAALLTGKSSTESFRETVFDENDARSDAQTKAIVKSADSVVNSFKKEACTLTAKSESEAVDASNGDESETANNNTPEGEDSSTGKTDEKEKKDASLASSASTSEGDRDEKGDKNKDSKPEGKPASDKKDEVAKKEEKSGDSNSSAAQTPLASQGSTVNPSDFVGSSAGNSAEVDALKDLLDGLKRAIAEKEQGEPLASLPNQSEEKSPSIPFLPPQEEGKEKGDKGKEEGKQQPPPQPPQEAKKENKPEQPKNPEQNKNPMANQQMPQMPQQQQQQPQKDEGKKLDLDPKEDRKENTPPPQDPRTAANLEMLKLQSGMGMMGMGMGPQPMGPVPQQGGVYYSAPPRPMVPAAPRAVGALGRSSGALKAKGVTGAKNYRTAPPK